MTVGSLFAGIGGFDLGASRVWGWDCVKWQVEIDPFCQRVLAKHWPNVPRYGDIRELTGGELEPVDLICGGFPCQPFSIAGRQGGSGDNRYLWPAMGRVIERVRPRWVVGENVPHLQRLALDQVCFDLEALGYEARTVSIPACAVDAPHIRERLWIVAHADRNDENRRSRDVQMGRLGSPGTPTKDGHSRRAEWSPEPGVGRVAHGIPHRMDRLRALGNAVVPQIPELLFRWIDQCEAQL